MTILRMRHTPSLLAALVLFVAAPVPEAVAQRGPAPVVVEEVRSEPLRQTTPVIGRFIPRQRGFVASRVAETVASIPVRVGERVDKGDIVARLRNDRLSSERNLRGAEVTEASATIEERQAALLKAQQTLSRVSALQGSNAFRKDRQDDAERDVESARSMLAAAEADLVRARASLRLAEIALADTVVRAPYPGVVTDKHTVEGAYLRQGDPVVTMINDLDLEIEADVPSNRVSGLEEGALVEALMSGGRLIYAAVRAVVPEENPRTRTRTVRLTPELPDPSVRMSGNEAVTVQIPIGEARNVVTVPKDAVLVRGAGRIVFVVVNGKVQPRPVQVGDGTGDRFVVHDGLAPGDMVVVRGNERLRPGQDVKPQS